MKSLACCFFTLILFFGSQTLLAHHSVNYHFDPDSSAQIQGMVKEFHFRNPHSGLVIEVAESDGSSAIWNIELVARATLIKQGWTDQRFIPGQVIRVSGFLARRAENTLYLRTAEFADGSNTSFEYGRLAQPEDLDAGSEDRVVDLSPLGNWVRAIEPTDPTRSGEAIDPDEVNPYLANLSELGRQAANAYDPTTDDPSIQCLLPSIVRVWGQPDYSPTNISQSGDVITIHHEMFDVVRTIYLAQPQIPDDYEPNVLGYSSGRFNGETLVVETRGFPAGVLLPHPGVPHSDQLETIERLSVDPSTGVLRVDWLATDALYYAKPQSGHTLFVRSDIPVGVFSCEL